MSRRLAVDVVLLPGRDASRLAVSLNRELRAELDGGIRLALAARDGFGVPHVSLAMGTIDETGLDELAGALEPVARDGAVRRGRVTSVAIKVNPLGLPVSSLALERDEALAALHAAVLAVTDSRLSSEADAGALLLQGEPPDEAALRWIRRYREHAAGVHFDPHITLGYGRARRLDDPPPVSFDALAVCHLGNGCTCRRLLGTWRWE